MRIRVSSLHLLGRVAWPSDTDREVDISVLPLATVLHGSGVDFGLEPLSTP